MKLLAVTGLALLAGPASAITYQYQGQPMQGYPGCELDPVCEQYIGVVLSGGMTIDETQVPNGLANAELSFSVEFVENNAAIGYLPYQVTSNGVVQEFEYPSDPDAWFSFSGDVGGLFGNLVAPSVSTWTFSFDSLFNIVGWDGNGGLFGGSNDYSISQGGDSFSGGTTSAPGAWTITSGPIAAVPLPTGSILLLSGLCGIGALRRRKDFGS